MFWNSINLQNVVNVLAYFSDVMHAFICSLLVLVVVLVFLLISFVLFSSIKWLKMSEYFYLDLFMTFIPILMVSYLGYYATFTLYIMEQGESSMNSVKVVGSQWFWDYETAQDHKSSFMNKENYYSRLLDVSDVLNLSSYPSTLVCVTSSDVLHSWAIPSLGVKVDAVTGRLNSVIVNPSVPGVYYGQCSEICGANHSFMPSVVEVF